MFEFLWAVFILGLPVAFMSWYLMYRLYQSGRVAKGASFARVKSAFGNINGKNKGKNGEKKDGNKPDDVPELNFAERRWVKFGGGFYGVTALVTWIIIEHGEGLSFIGNFPGFAEMFNDGIVNFIIAFLVNQFQNFIAALLWLFYWLEEGRSLLIWIGVPYIAYLAGVFVAGKSRNELVQLWNNRRIPGTKSSKEGSLTDKDH
ncbi:MAG TPA: hypothetical protein EYQ14_10880 [Gammaproteobacteria bacterium]|nr:hypothetical protein [Gammaproteobacteria bacterium]